MYVHPPCVLRCESIKHTELVNIVHVELQLHLGRKGRKRGREGREEPKERRKEGGGSYIIYVIPPSIFHPMLPPPTPLSSFVSFYIITSLYPFLLSFPSLPPSFLPCPSPFLISFLLISVSFVNPFTVIGIICYLYEDNGILLFVIHMGTNIVVYIDERGENTPSCAY